MKVDRESFFPTVRKLVFGGHMKQMQVDGINFILDTWEASVFTDNRWLAYMLGTAYHETATTMQPIHEYGSSEYLRNNYDVTGRRPDTARVMGNTQPGDGIKYCGRGYVQLTWKINYQRAGELLGVDLVGNPDLAMQPDIAARIMFEGMTNEKIVFEDRESNGQDFNFTGRTLEQYFNKTSTDWLNARRIINGLDHASLIAGTAKNFNTALQ